MIPGIKFTIKNGALGQPIQTRDGIMGMVCTGLASNNLLNNPVLVTSLEDYQAIALTLFTNTWTRTTTTATITTPSAHGLATGNSITMTVTSDVLAIPLGVYTVTVLTTTTFTITCLNGGATSGTGTLTCNSLTDTFALKHVAEFYQEAGRGSLLYLLLVAETQTMVNTVDVTFAAGAKKLLDFARGDIKVLGVVRNPTSEASVPANFYRADVLSAVTASVPLVNAYRDGETPLRVLLAGRLDVTSNVPTDLKAFTNNAIGIVVGDTNTGGNAAIGLALGRLARISVSTSLARVKDGPIVGVANAYIGAVKSEDFTQRAVLIDKGAITISTYPGRTGYFFSDDQMCASPTDDFTNLTGGRVLDKVQRINYQVYLDELHNSVNLDLTTGRISPEVIKSLEGKVELAVRTTMANELSGFDAYIDPAQNILALSKLALNAGITPFGYLRQIDITLGMNNPYN